jgi:hypothetical protein
MTSHRHLGSIRVAERSPQARPRGISVTSSVSQASQLELSQPGYIGAACAALWVQFLFQNVQNPYETGDRTVPFVGGATVAVNATTCDIGNTLGWMREGIPSAPVRG